MDIWNRANTEALRSKMTARTAELIDKLANNPGRKFTQDDLTLELDLDSIWTPRALLGILTSVSKEIGVNQENKHSWFILWEEVPKFRYWLSQERADWWLGNPDRKYWTLVADPTVYNLREAIQALDTDWWTTKGSNLRTGDRVAIWKTKGKDDDRGIVAFGEVVQDPEDRDDVDNAYWINLEKAQTYEERIAIRYARGPKLPLWIGEEHDDLLQGLNAAKSHGGTVFKVLLQQWEELLIVAGGWEMKKAAQRPNSWSIGENRETVSAYFDMLQLELENEKYVKKEYINKLVPLLNNRSYKAVEFKFQNISAVLEEEETPYIDGFKPLSKYQISLADEVLRQLAYRKNIQVAIKDKAANLNIEVPKTRDLASLLVDPPAKTLSKQKEGLRKGARKASKTDYIEREKRNSELGRAGEELVIQYEKDRLVQAGRSDLAGAVEWASDTEGDGLGYDIRSFEPDGSRIYIEVKTTKLGKSYPFHITESELGEAKYLGESYKLYRVFNFGNEDLGIFILESPLEDHCRLEATTYKGYFH